MTLNLHRSRFTRSKSRYGVLRLNAYMRHHMMTTRVFYAGQEVTGRVFFLDGRRHVAKMYVLKDGRYVFTPTRDGLVTEIVRGRQLRIVRKKRVRHAGV